MTTTPAHDLPGMTEAQFMAQVRRVAELFGYVVYHTYRSTRSPAGFPDLVLVRPAGQGREGRVVFAELKAQRTPVTDAQRTWLTVLAQAGAEAYLWRPNDWKAVERTLR